MSRLRSFAAFWWDFVVGDDWRLAVGVVLGLGLTAVTARLLGSGWWALPVIVTVALALSLRRVVTSRR